MKKILTLSILAILAICWIGCSDDDNETPKEKVIAQVKTFSTRKSLAILDF